MYCCWYSHSRGGFEERPRDVPAGPDDEVGLVFLQELFGFEGRGEGEPRGLDVVRGEFAFEALYFDVFEFVAFLRDEFVLDAVGRADEDYFGVRLILFYVPGDSEGGVDVTTRAASGHHYFHS